MYVVYRVQELGSGLKEFLIAGAHDVCLALVSGLFSPGFLRIWGIKDPGGLGFREDTCWDILYFSLGVQPKNNPTCCADELPYVPASSHTAAEAYILMYVVISICHVAVQCSFSAIWQDVVLYNSDLKGSGL